MGPAVEQDLVQKIFAWFAIVCCFGLLIFCGFDRRFAWSPVPATIALLGDALVLLGLLLTFIVLKQNPYSGSTVETFAEPGPPPARARHMVSPGTGSRAHALAKTVRNRHNPA